MKIELDIEIPHGFEVTGEYRRPNSEWYFTGGEAVHGLSIYERIILRKKQPLVLTYTEVASHLEASKFRENGTTYYLGIRICERRTPGWWSEASISSAGEHKVLGEPVVWLKKSEQP